jgi:hypothetical protein
MQQVNIILKLELCMYCKKKFIKKNSVVPVSIKICRIDHNNKIELKNDNQN